MKKLIIPVLALGAFCAGAEVAADYAEGEKSAPLVTPEAVALVKSMFGEEKGAELLHALDLQMTKYDRDMRSPSGRSAWHGRLIGEEIHTNEQVKVEVYSNEVNGVVWRYRVPFKQPQTITPLTGKVSTNGIPAKLAAARARRAAELAAVSNVTVNVIANAPKEVEKEGDK